MAGTCVLLSNGLAWLGGGDSVVLATAAGTQTCSAVRPKKTCAQKSLAQNQNVGFDVLVIH